MNRNILKKLTAALYIGVLCTIALSFSVEAFAQDNVTEYKPLTTVPGLFQKGVVTNPVSVIKGIYGLAIGGGAVIAIVMIMWGGFKYMYEESVFGKSSAKEQIMNAFLGLAVILSSYIILRTINASLVDFNVKLPGGTGGVAGLVADSKKYEVEVSKALALRSATQKDIKDLSDSIASSDKQIADLQSQLDAAKKLPKSDDNDAKIKSLEDQIAAAQTTKAAAQTALTTKNLTLSTQEIGNSTFLARNSRFAQEISTLSSAGASYATYQSGVTSLNTMSGVTSNSIGKVSAEIEKMKALTLTGADAQTRDSAVKSAEQDVEYLRTSKALMDVYSNNLANPTASSLTDRSVPFDKAEAAANDRIKAFQDAGRTDLADQLKNDLKNVNTVVRLAYQSACSGGVSDADKKSSVCQSPTQ